jgi:hypothetical protein
MHDTTALQTWLDEVSEALRSGRLLNADVYAAMDADAALDARDNDEEFDREWQRLWSRTESAFALQRPVARVVDAIEAIRKLSFLRVSRSTGQHEIAAYVSEDLDLIAKAHAAFGLDAEPFAEALWKAYRTGRFPGPPDVRRG